MLSQLEGSANHRLAKGGEGRVRTNEPGKPSKIKMENVDIVTPAGMLGRHESCVQGLSCEITADSSLMVTGANATGASSRTLLLGEHASSHGCVCAQERAAFSEF